MTNILKRFILGKSNFFIGIICIIIALLVFVLDLAFLPLVSLPAHIYWLREGLIVGVFLLATFIIYRRHAEQERHLVYKLKTSFFAILGLYISVGLSRIIFGSRAVSSAEEVSQFLVLLQNNLKVTFTAVFVTLFLIVLLFLLRDFIYYKSRMRTHRLFRFGLLLFLVYVIYGHYTSRVLKTEWSFQGRTPLEWVLFSLLLLTIVILSFRTSWVAYLNKRQKYLASWAGILLILGAYLLLQSNILEEITRYSFILGSFNTFAFYFISIYLVMSVLNLLLHLPTASIFDKKMREIESLQNLSRDISSILGYDEVVAKVTSLTREALNSDSSWLEMNQVSEKLQIVSSQNLTDDEIRNMPLSQESGLSGWIIKNRQSVLVNEVLKDSRTAHILEYKKNVGSVLGVPLRSKHDVIGILYATKAKEYGFDQDDREMLQAFANQATVAIDNARLVKESIEKERLEQELKVAQDTQMRLLPKQMPRIEHLDVDAFCLTATEVGGDYFDLIKLDEHRLGVVIADVSGKGLSAAFYMAELKGIVNAVAKLTNSPQKLLQQVNQILFATMDRKTFVSMIYAIFDMKKKRITYCRAGHGPLIHFSSEHELTTFLQPKGIGVALDGGRIFDSELEEAEIMWKKNDFFVFFTDGLNEARNASLEEYGDERILQSLNISRGKSAGDIQKAILEDVSNFMGDAKRHDDLSIIVVKSCS